MVVFKNQRQAKDHGLADAEQCGANGNFGNSAIIFTLRHQEDGQTDGQRKPAEPQMRPRSRR